MGQNVILAILIFVTTTALCAQATPSFRLDATLERTAERKAEWKAQTQTGFRNYLYWNKGASYNLGTLWVNGISKELDIFVSKDHKIYASNDDLYAANEETKKLLREWKYDEMQTLTKPRKTRIPYQFVATGTSTL